MRCEDVAILLSESAEGSGNLPRSVARHTERCLRCQAEQAQYRRIRRAMLAMRAGWVEPAPGLVSEIVALVNSEGLAEDAKAPSDLRRAAYVAAAATAATAAATAAGAIVLAARSKRPAS